jgi:DNA-binding MarR family transcriptional regulator
MISILEMVKQGRIAADIARTLNMKKSQVSYYITKAKGRGYIKEVTRDVCSILELTQAGSKFLDQYHKKIVHFQYVD